MRPTKELLQNGVKIVSFQFLLPTLDLRWLSLEIKVFSEHEEM